MSEAATQNWQFLSCTVLFTTCLGYFLQFHGWSWQDAMGTVESTWYLWAYALVVIGLQIHQCWFEGFSLTKVMRMTAWAPVGPHVIDLWCAWLVAWVVVLIPFDVSGSLLNGFRSFSLPSVVGSRLQVRDGTCIMRRIGISAWVICRGGG